MQIPINKLQIVCIQTLLSKLNQKSNSKDMVSGFSGGRTDSTTKLFNDEANAMIKHLKSLDPVEAAADKMRKKIISFAHEMGWTIIKDGKRKADMKRIDDFCLKSGYIKKKLDRYSYNELPKLVTQFETVYNSYLNSF